MAYFIFTFYATKHTCSAFVHGQSKIRRTVADPESQSPLTPVGSVNGSWPLPQSEKNFSWADGYRAIYSAYHANITCRIIKSVVARRI